MEPTDILKLTLEVKKLNQIVSDLRSLVQRNLNNQEIYNKTHVHPFIGSVSTPIPTVDAENLAISLGLQNNFNNINNNFNNVIKIEKNQVRLKRLYEENENLINQNIVTLNSVNEITE